MRFKSATVAISSNYDHGKNQTHDPALIERTRTKEDKEGKGGTNEKELEEEKIEDSLISQTRNEIKQALNLSNNELNDQDSSFIQRQYTQLLSEIYSKKKQAVNDPENYSLITLIDKANQLVDQVHNTTAASLDSKILALTAELGAERISKMKSTGSLFDIFEFTKLINSTLQKEEERERGNREEILKNLGNKIASEWWNGVIVTREMLDELVTINNENDKSDNEGNNDDQSQQEGKKRTNKRKRTNKDDLYVLVQAQVMDAQMMAQQQISTVAECNKHVMETFEILSQYDRIPYYKLIIDPDSFAHTIENQYYAAFLVHENWAKMSFDSLDSPPSNHNIPSSPSNQPESKVNGKGGKRNKIEKEKRGNELWIEAVQSKEEKEILDDSHKKNQMIVNITFNKWKEMIKRYKISSALLKRDANNSITNVE